MRKIAPSQFIEAVLEVQHKNSLPTIKLTARTFNKMVDRLCELNIYVRFGFSDLLESIEYFDKAFSYTNFTLLISYSEPVFKEVQQYNQIYASIENFSEINQAWKNLMK